MKVKLPLVFLFFAFLLVGCSASGAKTLPAPEVTISQSTPQPPASTATSSPSGTPAEKGAPIAAQAPPVSAANPTEAASPAPTATAPVPTALPSSSPTSSSLSGSIAATDTPVAAVSPSPTPTSLPTLPPQTETPAPTPTLASPSETQASPTAAPVQAPATPQAPSIAQSCQDQAAFYADVTIPDDTSFRQGINFVKTWQIKNTGTCTWGPTYSLIFAGGDIMNGPQSVPLPVVNPGDIFDISVNLTSPANGGVYLGDWEFQRPDGTRFGVNSDGIDMIWVKISVSYIVVGPTATPNPISATCTGQTNSDYINTVLSLINNVRAANNLPQLALNAKLSAAAQAHSNDMACKDFVDHVGSDGSTWFTRIQAQGYTYSYASENIYVGNPAFGGDANGAFTWWMNSQVHRDNILSPKITQIGIGYTFYDKSTYGGYFTVDFAHP